MFGTHEFDRKMKGKNNKKVGLVPSVTLFLQNHLFFSPALFFVYYPFTM